MPVGGPRPARRGRAMAGGGWAAWRPCTAPGGQQGKEKRRDPRTAPDEDLYTEDRPWTEAVIGNRRRRDVHDGKQGEQEDQ